MSLEQVLTLLPRLAVTDHGSVSFSKSDVVLLALLADAADNACRPVARGIGRIGLLMTCAAPELLESEQAGGEEEVIADLGNLLAALGEWVCMLNRLADNCRVGVADAGLR